MRSGYREREVQALIEEYEGLMAKRDTTPAGLNTLVRIADLDAALARLPDEYWGVVLLHGMLGLPTRAVGELLKKSHTWVGKRYTRALEEIHYLMNGGE